LITRLPLLRLVNSALALGEFVRLGEARGLDQPGDFEAGLLAQLADRGVDGRLLPFRMPLGEPPVPGLVLDEQEPVARLVAVHGHDAEGSVGGQFERHRGPA